MTIRLGIVGVGKIARDQHLPALAANPDFDLVAAANRSGPVEGVPTWPSIEEMVAATPGLDAVTLCSPPMGRHAIARHALDKGLNVMLEKPPGASISEVEDLAATAAAKGLTLFATWHAREAPAVEPARSWLADKAIRSVRVDWKEDVRRWHPGQTWIWEPGGLGIFDPGINALSVVTRILPRRLFLTGASLSFPANRAAPIAAALDLTDAAGTPIRAEFDWRQTGDQIWEIAVETDAGLLHLSNGGAKLEIAGEIRGDATLAEYPGLYRRFAELIGKGASDVDLSPFRLVADAFMLGTRREVEAFDD